MIIVNQYKAVLVVTELVEVKDGVSTQFSDEAETDPLVGMSLLYGYDLRIRAVECGKVTIELPVNLLR